MKRNDTIRLLPNQRRTVMNISISIKEERDFICGADSAIYCGNERGGIYPAAA